MKPLLVGEAPNQSDDSSQPLAGRVGHRLAKLSGLSFDAYLDRFERINVLNAWPGAASTKGARFDSIDARDAATRIWTENCIDGRTVLLLGKRVASAFRIKEDYFEAKIYPQFCTIVVVPHPSGVNTWWNDPVNTEKARTFMTTVADGHQPTMVHTNRSINMSEMAQSVTEAVKGLRGSSKNARKSSGTKKASAKSIEKSKTAKVTKAAKSSKAAKAKPEKVAKLHVANGDASAIMSQLDVSAAVVGIGPAAKRIARVQFGDGTALDLHIISVRDAKEAGEVRDAVVAWLAKQFGV